MDYQNYDTIVITLPMPAGQALASNLSMVRAFIVMVHEVML